MVRMSSQVTLSHWPKVGRDAIVYGSMRRLRRARREETAGAGAFRTRRLKMPIMSAVQWLRRLGMRSASFAQRCAGLAVELTEGGESAAWRRDVRYWKKFPTAQAPDRLLKTVHDGRSCYRVSRVAPGLTSLGVQPPLTLLAQRDSASFLPWSCRL
jgi:hypothetical protein